MAILQKSGYKMLLHGGETINDQSESDGLDSQRNAPSSKPEAQGVSAILKNHQGQNPGNLEGRALSALNRFGENARTVSEPTWLRRVQHQQEVMEPSSNSLLFHFIVAKFLQVCVLTCVLASSQLQWLRHLVSRLSCLRRVCPGVYF